jgi:hypothetical protein
MRGFFERLRSYPRFVIAHLHSINRRYIQDLALQVNLTKILYRSVRHLLFSFHTLSFVKFLKTVDVAAQIL